MMPSGPSAPTRACSATKKNLSAGVCSCPSLPYHNLCAHVCSSDAASSAATLEGKNFVGCCRVWIGLQASSPANVALLSLPHFLLSRDTMPVAELRWHLCAGHLLVESCSEFQKQLLRS